MMANEEIKIQRCSSFKDRKKTNIDNFDEIVLDKHVFKNNNNMNANDVFIETNKDAEPKLHKNVLFRSLDEHAFNNLMQTYQIPVEYSLEKSEFILEPQNYKYLQVIGEGEYGKIYLTQSMKDNQYYAMKIETFKNRGEAHKSQKITKMVKDFLKNTNSEGICKIYGDIWLKKNNLYYYYVLMEKAERDMEQELVIRGNYIQYYSEIDLTNVLCQLIITCSQLQKNNIAHRDIKPQNILILNGRYKLCDFGEAISFNKTGVGVVVQKIRGTELYMSPILFFGLKKEFEKVKHNAYKSDVFSLGLCILLAGTLNYDSICQIRELTDMETIKNIITYYLSPRYSISFISFLLKMLEVDENKRPDFIQLENLLVKK
jgi:serine/threonine protein kinase